MIRNLLMVAIRNLKKDKSYSLLNILGLTIGITFCLLLLMYIMDELAYDRYHVKAGRIHRIISFVKEPENSMKWAATQFPLGPALAKDYPEVEQSVRLVTAERAMYKNGEQQFYENKVFYADSNLFQVFTYKLLEGNLRTALREPHSIVLIRTLAEKYFGKGKTAQGKSLQNNRNESFKVTAVVEDPPRNSHLLYSALISISTLPPDFSNNWGNFGYYTYVLLRPNTNAQAFQKKLLPMYDKYMAPIFSKFNIKIHYGVQPITDIHLHSDLTGEPEELGSISYIYIFSAVALFMLVIACINYMNLTTARSARRAKEIGIRKVTGSLQSQLIAQFLIESTLIALLSLLLSILAVYLLLPAFNAISGKFIAFSTLLEPGKLLILLVIVLFVGLLSGSYPAFYLAGFSPVTVLKGRLSKSSSNIILRKSLVVLQFTISMIMLICTWVVYRQLESMRNQDLGFRKEQVISLKVDANGDIRGKLIALKNEIRKNPGVLSASTAWTAPGGDGAGFNLFSIESNNGFVDKGIDCYGIDEDYLHTLGMQLIRGRNFSFSTPSDTLRSILVNEQMVRDFGWKQPIGKKVKFPGDTSGRFMEVIGVVKDFHQKSLYNPIAALILFYRPGSNNIQVKISPVNILATVSHIESTWKSILPALPFQYSFLDQDFNSQYAADQKRGKIFTAFSTLTIAITCLGLLGLVAYTTEQRQKEISVRKIMGAGIPSIVSLITRNFLLLVCLSCLIAFPIAWYCMHRWLRIFPYKTSLDISIFFVSAAAVLLITLITVSFHTVKAAVASPVKGLRIE